MNLNEWAKAIHENAVDHGWWDEPRTFGEIVALCHSELSEALEEYRDGKPALYIENNKPEGTAVEMADCLIRILDWFGHEGIDPENIVGIKHQYNLGRSRRHGGKRL
jgi:predicted HAD superfamily Cof-like phosphohydrolase